MNFSENFQFFKICIKNLTYFFETFGVFLNVSVVSEYFKKVLGQIG